MSTFDFEKLNNPLVKALQAPEFSATLQAIIDRHAVVIVPHSESLSEITIGKSFVSTHVALRHAERPECLLVVCGMLVVADENESGKSLHVISQKKRMKGLPEAKTVYDANPNIIGDFDSESRRYRVVRHTVRVLHEGEILLKRTLVPIILVSEPLVYEGCKWSKEALAQVLNGPAPTDTESRLVSLRWLFGGNKKAKTHGIAQPVAKQAPISNDFYEKLKDPQASDISRMMASFMEGFSQRPPKPNDMGTVVHTFIDLVLDKMETHTLWANSSREEFEEAYDAIEKLVVVKLYNFCFVVTDQDEILSNRIKALQWIDFTHLEIKNVHRRQKRLERAISELRNMENFKAPKDKMVCVLNCCRAVYSILNSASKSGHPAGADEFLPLLIYTTIKANPPNLHASVTFISRFRNPSKLITETGYYLTHLMSVLLFIEQVDASQLKIEPSEFERLMGIHGKAEEPKNKLLQSVAEAHLSDSHKASLSLLLPQLQGSHKATRDAFGSDSKSAEVSDETFTPPLQPRFDPLDVAPDAESTESEKMFHFLNTSADEIRVSEVPSLLSLFKRLHDECLELTKSLEEVKAENARLKTTTSSSGGRTASLPPSESLI